MGSSDESRFYIFGKFCLDTREKTLLEDGSPVALTLKSFEILQFLARNPGKMIPKNDFFAKIWSESHVDETNLTQHIYRIRKIIESEQEKDVYIETLPKLGYRFVADIESFDTKPGSSNGNVTPETNGSKDLSSVSANARALRASKAVGSEINSSDPNNPGKTNLSLSKRTKQNSRFTSRNAVIAFVLGALLCFTLMQFYYNSSFAAVSTPNEDLIVAVLPFSEIGKVGDEGFGLGMADTIISKISGLGGISANPTEDIAAFAKQHTDFHEQDVYNVGSQLHADVVLTGTIQRENDVIRVNMRAYHVTKKRHICSIKFDEVDKGVFSLQDDISERVKQKLVEDINAHKIAKDGVKFE